jgi:hypothetical protein
MERDRRGLLAAPVSLNKRFESYWPNLCWYSSDVMKALTISAET